jgi:hypothetical protein
MPCLAKVFRNGETKLPQNENQEVGNGDNAWLNIQVPINKHVKILDVHAEVPQYYAKVFKVQRPPHSFGE